VGEQVNLTINQFCAAVPCGRTKAYELIADGEIQAMKLGKKTLIPRAELVRLQARLPRMRARASGPPETENSAASSERQEAAPISNEGWDAEVSSKRPSPARAVAPDSRRPLVKAAGGSAAGTDDL
jgi:excisionase family DNA binding protein